MLSKIGREVDVGKVFCLSDGRSVSGCSTSGVSGEETDDHGSGDDNACGVEGEIGGNGLNGEVLKIRILISRADILEREPEKAGIFLLAKLRGAFGGRVSETIRGDGVVWAGEAHQAAHHHHQKKEIHLLRV